MLLKWTEHETGAHRDPKMRKLLRKYGGGAYGLYWFIVELIGDDITAAREDNGFLREDADEEFLALEMGFEKDEVERMLDYMVEIDLFQRVDGRVFCDAILSRCDAYTRKASKRVSVQFPEVSGQCTDSVQTPSVHPSYSVSSSISPSSSEEEQEVSQADIVVALTKSYQSQHKYFNGLTEHPHIRRLAEIAAHERDPTAWCKRFLETAKRMHGDPKCFLSRQPFLPHIHMGKTFDHIVAQMERRDDGEDLEVVV